MKIHKVGGAVRDRLLGRPVADVDWVVVGASVNHIASLGYKAVGVDFAVFLHPTTGEEYSLARQDRTKTVQHGRFSFFTSEDVTLEEDLSRRDLTINAIAESQDGQLIDPFGGQADLFSRTLRHVSNAFAEDPLRVLRVASFAARYHHLGFTVAVETLQLMATMTADGALNELAPERVWKEISRALMEPRASVFVQVLRDCGALKVLMPEVDQLFGTPQSVAHYPEIDTGVHTLMVLDQACQMNAPLTVRWSALLHDLGKGATPKNELPHHHNHDRAGLALIEAVNARFKVPAECANLARVVGGFHTRAHKALELRPVKVLEVFQRTDAFRRPEIFEQFLLACEADSRGRLGYEKQPYPQRQFLLEAFEAARSVQAAPYVAAGLTGLAIGEAVASARTEEISRYIQTWKSAPGLQAV